MRDDQGVNGGQAAQDSEYVELVAAHIIDDDWHGVYTRCKGWIGSGGGAGLVDPWLGYVASGLMHGQPRTAIHAVDLALGNWLPRPLDRSVMHWVRSRVVRNYLNDPRTALSDLAISSGNAPSWLRPCIADDASRCEAEAARSRKRKPSVAPAPAFAGSDFASATLAARLLELQPDGSQPLLWEAIRPLLDGGSTTTPQVATDRA